MTTTPMTPERLREIAALCEAATPGPWRWGDWRADFGLIESEFRCTLEYSPEHGAFDGPVKRHRDEGGERVLSVEDDVENPADKRLIAASRTAIPELLAEVARLSDHSGILEFQRDAFHDQLTALRADLAETNLVLEQQDRDLERQRARIIALETGLRKIHDDALYDQNHERYLEIAAILDRETP